MPFQSLVVMRCYRADVEREWNRWRNIGFRRISRWKTGLVTTSIGAIQEQLPTLPLTWLRPPGKPLSVVGRCSWMAP